jgi:hypothetical protein
VRAAAQHAREQGERVPRLRHTNWEGVGLRPYDMHGLGMQNALVLEL